MTEGAAGLSDARLVERTRAGDLSAFEALYRRHRRAVRRVLAGALGDPEDVRDAVQQTFVRALGGLDSLGPEADIATWLATIAQATAAAFAANPVQTEDASPEDVHTLVSEVSGVLAELGPADATALAMAGYLDASAATIGRELAISVDDAAAAVRRARRRLQTGKRIQSLVHSRAAGGAPHTVAPRRPAALEVTGPSGEKTVPLVDVLVVGRECAGYEKGQRLIVRDPAVSRLHLELRVDPGTARISAVDRSRNGTTLNGSEMQTGSPIVLVDGDTLRLGDTRLVLRINADDSHAPARTETFPLPPADITLLAFPLAVTARGTAAAPLPDGLRTRLVNAAGLFGGIADVLTATSLMVRWPATGPLSESQRTCDHYLDFARMLCGDSGIGIEWTVETS